MKKRIFQISYFIIPIVLIALLLSFFGFYGYWNSAAPDRTCASCHEISSSVNSLAHSSHRNLHCKECHGTALSNGFHSLKEKGMMVVNHVQKKHVEDIRMDEEQIIEVMDQCNRCHAAEFAKWKSGGHSMDYASLFLNQKHNTTEQINFDCLRCHGMYYDGEVADVVQPIDIQGPWKLKNEKQAPKPVIPCMACHQIHQKGEPSSSPDYSNPQTIFYTHNKPQSKVSFYDRHEKNYIAAVDLPKLKVWYKGTPVLVSDDETMRNCVQCHAPNAHHKSGTSDDRTPRGVHEGLSCLACHDPHNNDARQSCSKCHPALSNCGLDVAKMNTTFADSTSNNNIHFVSCADCHTDEKMVRILN
jgi:hypothetical protein